MERLVNIVILQLMLFSFFGADLKISFQQPKPKSMQPVASITISADSGVKDESSLCILRQAISYIGFTGESIHVE